MQLKDYYIDNDDNYFIIENNEKKNFNLTIQQKIKKIIAGKAQILKRTDYYIIYKVCRTYELKLVCIIKINDFKFKVLESICETPTKNEYLKLVINFSNQLRNEGIQNVGVRFI